MRRRILSLALLLAMLLTLPLTAGCSRAQDDAPVKSNAALYLARINFYGPDGTLRDRYVIDYDPTGTPVKITSGILPDQRYENTLTDAPLLPDGVRLDEAEETYKAIMLAPCDEGTALLVAGTAQEPLWGMILYGDREDYVERDGYLTKVTARDGTYAAFFYFPLSTASSEYEEANSGSLEVTEDSEYYGYDKVLSTLATALVAMENNEPASLNELLFSPLYASEPNKRDIGYAFVDLDDNGTKELIIGGNGQYGRSVIYDLYAIYNGRIVNVLSGTDGNRHTLSSGNQILLNTKNEAGQTVFAAFTYYNSSLRLLDAVIQGNGERFKSSQSLNDDSTFEPISYTEAAAIEERYPEVEIEFTSISEYIENAGIADSAEE